LFVIDPASSDLPRSHLSAHQLIAKHLRTSQQISTAARSFDKVKALVEEIEREWAKPPAAKAVPDFSINHRSQRPQISVRDPIAIG
jgi:hypothetical protein